MKVNAYILAADPAWIEASVLSYYDHVDRIVVSYDECGRGYTGLPVDVEQCVSRLKAIDRDGKFDFRPGKFAYLDRRPMENETFQRRVAISQAGVEADWIIQLDQDELLPNPAGFLEVVRRADVSGFDAVDYPALWLYSSIDDRRFLAWCRRGGRVDVTYPGAMAIKPSVTLAAARRPTTATYWVDIRKRNKFNGFPIHVRETIPTADSIVHLSMVRSEEELRRKFATWSHSSDRDWSPELETWLLANRSPRTAAFASQFDFSARRRHLWPAQISERALELMQYSPKDLRQMRETRTIRTGLATVAGGLNRAYLIPACRRVVRALERRVRRFVGLKGAAIAPQGSAS